MTIADLALDRRCVGCSQEPTLLCRSCWSAMVASGPVRLAAPDARGPGPLDVASGGPYAGPLRHAILAHKERATPALARPLGIILARAVAAVLPSAAHGPIMVIPVPAHATSLRRRGEDTVARIAAYAASALRAIGEPASVHTMLRRLPGSRQQAHASARQRWLRQEGSMVCRVSTWPHPHVVPVIVDDVLTTGATCAEAVRALTARFPRTCHGPSIAVLAHVATPVPDAAGCARQFGYVGAAPDARRSQLPRSS